MKNENQDDKKFEEFIKWLGKEGLMLCPMFDMQEKYCPYYYHKYKDATGGFCKCPHGESECCSCHEKEWNEELGIPVDKIKYQQCLDDETREKPLIHKGKPLEAYFKK